MDDWLIEKLKKEEQKEVQVPLFLELPTQVEVIITKETEEDQERGVFEIQIL